MTSTPWPKRLHRGSWPQSGVVTHQLGNPLFSAQNRPSATSIIDRSIWGRDPSRGSWPKSWGTPSFLPNTGHPPPWSSIARFSSSSSLFCLVFFSIEQSTLIIRALFIPPLSSPLSAAVYKKATYFFIAIFTRPFSAILQLSSKERNALHGRPRWLKD